MLDLLSPPQQGRKSLPGPLSLQQQDFVLYWNGRHPSQDEIVPRLAFPKAKVVSLGLGNQGDGNHAP